LEKFQEGNLLRKADVVVERLFCRTSITRALGIAIANNENDLIEFTSFVIARYFDPRERNIIVVATTVATVLAIEEATVVATAVAMKPEFSFASPTLDSEESLLCHDQVSSFVLNSIVF
jgi:hypothetical protein